MGNTKKEPASRSQLIAFGVLIFLSAMFSKACAGVTDDYKISPGQMKQQEEPATQWRPKGPAIQLRLGEAKRSPGDQFFDKFLAEGTFRDIQIEESAATVWVDSTFYNLSFEAKRGVCRIVYIYTPVDKMNPFVIVTLKDYLSGKKVGKFDPFGFEME